MIWREMTWRERRIEEIQEVPHLKVLLDAGMSLEEINEGSQLFLTGEFMPIRKQNEEDPEIVREIEAQDSTSISGVLLEICKKTDPDSATRHLAISRFIFLANGGKGPQTWYGHPTQ